MRKATIEDINAVQRRVKVQLTSELVDKAFETHFKSIQSKATLQGFRPGKAPMSIIKKLYSDRAQYNVLESLVESHLFPSIEDNKLKPIASPVLEKIESLPSPGKSFDFSAVVDILPTIVVPEYKGLNLAIESVAATDEDVEKELKAVQRKHAKEAAAPENTEAAAGMMVEISHKASVHGESMPEFDAKGVKFELGTGFLYEALDQGIVGMKVGETKLIHVDFQADYPEAKVAGKHVHFELTLDDLKVLDVPAIDDELAKDENSESLDSLKTKIKSALENRSSQLRRNRLENAAFDAIRGKSDFDVPPAMVDRVIDEMIREGSRGLKGKELEEATANQEMRLTLREPAKLRCRNTLLLMEIIKKEELKVEDADLDSFIESQFGLSVEALGEDAFKGYRDILRKQGNLDRVLFDKAIKLIIDQAVITEK